MGEIAWQVHLTRNAPAPPNREARQWHLRCSRKRVSSLYKWSSNKGCCITEVRNCLFGCSRPSPALHTLSQSHLHVQARHTPLQESLSFVTASPGAAASPARGRDALNLSACSAFRISSTPKMQSRPFILMAGFTEEELLSVISFFTQKKSTDIVKV